MQESKQYLRNKGKENTLVVIRHGSTDLNGDDSSDKIRGWLDVPLSDKGIKDVNDSLPDLKKAKIDGLVTSDLSRCIDTAKIISKELGIPILGKSANLRPWNVGEWTGKPTKEVLPLMQELIKNSPDQSAPGGESFNNFKTRFLTFIQQIQKDYPYDKIGIVTSHRGERLMQGWKDQGMPKNPLEISSEAFMNKGVPPGSFTDFQVKV